MSNFDSKIYVDTSALQDWKIKMSNINNASIEIIKEINEKMKDIDQCIAGNIAEGIKHDIYRLTKNCLSSHENMKDLEQILSKIVETKINE